MATTGSGRHGRPRPAPRRRSRRGWYLAAGAGVALALVAWAIVSAGGPPPPAATGARTGGATREAGAGPGAAPARSGSASPAQSGAGLEFCQTQAAASLRTVLARAVPGSSQAEVQPLGVAGDGRRVYVSAWTPDFSGVGLLSLATGRLRSIRPFGDPTTDQADGAADGRWLVWAQTYSLSSLDRFTMYAFDSATRKLRRIGHSIAGPGGVPWPSPWHAPAVSGQYAAWAQGYGPAAWSRSGWPTWPPGRSPRSARATSSRRCSTGTWSSGRSQTRPAPRPRCAPTA